MFWSLVAGAAVIATIALTLQHFRKSKLRTEAPAPAQLYDANVTVGRATSRTTMRAPLSGRECVYWTVMITKPGDPRFALSESRTSIVGVETASGERFGFTGDGVRYALSSVSPYETKVLALRDMPVGIRALLDRETEDDALFEVMETSLAPSSTIYVTARKTAAPDELRVEAIYDVPPRAPVVRTSAPW